MGSSSSLPKRRTLAAELRERILALPGVEERPLHLSHATVPRAYWIGRAEFVHFHGQHQLDIRVPDAAVYAEILKDPRAKVNPHARSRIELDFTTPRDAEDAFRVVERVYALLTPQ